MNRKHSPEQLDQISRWKESLPPEERSSLFPNTKQPAKRGGKTNKPEKQYVRPKEGAALDHVEDIEKTHQALFTSDFKAKKKVPSRVPTKQAKKEFITLPHGYSAEIKRVARELRKHCRTVVRSGITLPSTPSLNRLLELKALHMGRDYRVPSLEKIALALGFIRPSSLRMDDNFEIRKHIDDALRAVGIRSPKKYSKRETSTPAQSIERELLEEAGAMPSPLAGGVPRYGHNPSTWEEKTQQEARKILRWLKTEDPKLMPDWFQVRQPTGLVASCWMLPENRKEISRILADRLAIEKNLTKKATKDLRSFFSHTSKKLRGLNTGDGQSPSSKKIIKCLTETESRLERINAGLSHARETRRKRRELELLTGRKISTGWCGMLTAEECQRRKDEAERLRELAEKGIPTIQEITCMPSMVRFDVACRILGWFLDNIGLVRDKGLNMWLLVSTLPKYLPRRNLSGPQKRPGQQRSDPVFTDWTRAVDELLCNPRTQASLDLSESVLASLLAAVLAEEFRKLSTVANFHCPPNGTPLAVACMCFLTFPSIGPISGTQARDREKWARKQITLPTVVKKEDMTTKDQDRLYPPIYQRLLCLPPLDPRNIK